MRKKTIYKLLLLFFAFLLIISIIYQIKAEQYKCDLIENHIFHKRDRTKFKPFVIFYVESKLFGKHKKSWVNSNSTHSEYELTQNRKPGDTYTIPYNIEYNAYLRYCYYDND